jgi:hypothetical protein
MHVPLLEGQQQTFTVNFENWDNSEVDWYLVGSNGIAVSGSQVTPNAGITYPSAGNSTLAFNFTFNSDATTDGPATYYIRVENAAGGLLFPQQGPFYVRDSSQAPALVLDLDSNNWAAQTWTDTSGQNNGASTANMSKSTDNGGVLILNGTSAFANVSNLQNSTYGDITLSAWIKPSQVNRTQAIIAKELCYKLRITADGSITIGTAKGYSPWEVTATASAGLITAGAWAQVVATSDANYTRIYVNGVKVAETSGNIIGANLSPFSVGTDNDTQGDLFGGRMGEVKVWNYALTEAFVIGQYNLTAARYGLSTIPLSLDFVGSGTTFLQVANTQSDWNLGSTYTIEFWSKGGNASTGVYRIVMSQGGSDGRIDVGYSSTHLLFNNSDKLFAEPTPGVWTHVAFVRESGSSNITLYYNGVNQTTFSAGIPLTDSSTDLVVGRRGAGDYQYFYGKLAMIRISSAAKYTADFTPDNSYGVESDTKLLLGYDPLFDKTTTHAITNTNVGVSTDFPISQSLQFSQISSSRLYAAASNDWNLGTTWTIEFWVNAPRASDGVGGPQSGIWGLFNQAGWSSTDNIVVALSGGCLVFLSIASQANADVRYTEPTPGQWTHVAIVNNSGTQQVWYNGVEQTKVSGTFGTASYTNSTDPLYIGSLSPANGSPFDGKLALVRISNAAKYTADFTATTKYGVESDTKLFLSKLNPTVDAKSHSITNTGITTSTSFPN